MKSAKIFGICLTLLGIFTVVCVIISLHSVYTPSLDSSYRMGLLMGSAITECSVGLLLQILK